MKILVTGAAGFIGFFTAKQLLDRGDAVVGLDNFNDYYDVSLKEARAKRDDARTLLANSADPSEHRKAANCPDQCARVANCAAEDGESRCNRDRRSSLAELRTGFSIRRRDRAG